MGALADGPLRALSVGGGPAGLFYAGLARRHFPRHEVTVVERNPHDATFGFGVVFSERTLDSLRDADPEAHAAIDAASVAWEDIEVRIGGQVLRVGGHGFSAIARKTLLQILQERAAAAGAELRFEHEGDPEGGDAQLVLGADGVNSAVRGSGEEAFRPRFAIGEAKYIWFATPQPFDALTFAFVENEHGWWGVHAYPFDERSSTFIVETDEASWRRAGLDGAAAQALPPGVSDMESLRYCEEVFAEHLGGHGLLENNSKWLDFRTLRCASWHDGRRVLLGDAAHTAHFSVGSGTKMAMEDAVALAGAVAEADDVTGALRAYEAARRPRVEFIQRAETPSRIWWERFRHVAPRAPEQFAFHFLSRSPVVTRDRLRGRDPRFVKRVERWFGAGDSPLAAPLATDGLRLPSRVVAAPGGGGELLVRLGGLALAGAGLVLIPGGDPAGWPPLLEWLHAHTPAEAGVRLPAGATAAEAEAAGEAGAGVLALALDDAAALAGWPSERPALVRVSAPAVDDTAAGDAALAALARLARDERRVWAGVAPPAEGDESELAGAQVTQLLFCDQVVQELGLLVVLADGEPSGDDAATAVLAGRAALVQGVPSLADARWAPSGALPAAAPVIR